jgi:periplasmic protein CpxP/Spy
MNSTSLKTIFVSTIAGILLIAPIAPQADAAPRQTQIAQRQADPARRAEMDTKRAEMKAKIDAILTPAQQQQLKDAMISGLNPRMAMAQLNLTDAQKAQLKAAFPKLAALNLTDAQKTQIAQIAQQTRQQVQGILTAPQQEQLKSAIAQGQDPKDAMKSIGISDSQRTQLRQVHKSSKEAFTALLTPEQRQQMGGRGEGNGQMGRRGDR